MSSDGSELEFDDVAAGGAMAMGGDMAVVEVGLPIRRRISQQQDLE